MASIILAVALIVIAALCFAFVWRGLDADTHAIDKLGARYGMKRWPGETNGNFADRIRHLHPLVTGEPTRSGRRPRIFP